MASETSLNKSLTLGHVVFLGLAWMTPMIYFTVYGIAYQASEGNLTQAYFLSFVAIFFTAFSYGVMSRTFPASGSAYTYSAQSLHPRIGFLVGWALQLDYLFSPLIACLTFGIYLHEQFPAVPSSVFIVALVLILGVVNALGVDFSARLSKWFVIVQMVFIAAFSLFLIRNLLGGGYDPLAPFTSGNTSLYTILSGSSIICFSFLGFDSITTLSEETVNSRRIIPKAIMIIIFVAITLYLIPSYLTQLVYPHLTFADADSAGFEIVRQVGGAGLGAAFVTVLVMAIFTQGVSSVVSCSRLLYVMGRDSILPKRLFGYVHPKFKTPVFNVAVACLFSLLALTVSLETAVKFVNFGALTAFFFVNVSVIAKRYVRDKERSLRGTALYLLFPLAGASFIGWLLTRLSKDALAIGLVWLAAGAAYYLYRERGKRLAAKSEAALRPGAPS